MFSAQNTLSKKIATSVMGVAFLLVSANDVLASSTTTIGEFFYNDDYTPDLTATCTLNVKDTSGSVLISSQSLTPTADGWYGHSFTSPTTVGYYRSEVCCDTTTGDHMCIDKSFNVDPEVTASSSDDIASAVWGYSGRTLTSFNSLVSDIWGYASRTLTPSSSNGDLSAIAKDTKETRLLIEELVNKPIIENSFEDFQDFDLLGKVKDGQRVSEELYINILLADSSISKLTKSWNSYKEEDLLKKITEIKEILGEESDSSSDATLFAKVNYLRDSFGYREADLIYEDILALKGSLNYTQTTIAVSGVNKNLLKEIKSSSAYLKSSEKSLTAINKRLKEAEGLSGLIEKNLSSVNNVLGTWTEKSSTEKSEEVEQISKSALSINRIPKAVNIFSSIYEDISGDKKLKNKLLSTRALLFANKKLIVSGNKTALLTNWLEEGSLVIKTLITNPSTLISQDVPLKYYLPVELTKEDIIETDAGVEVKYDTEKGGLYVEGNFSLKPSETKTIKVRVEDVWTISESEIDSLKAQSESLIKPLEKTAFYAQGITLKSDIDVSLEKVKGLLKDEVTPEGKIKAYREAKLELSSVLEKIEKLKDLVSQASSSGSILGFVGGSQAIAVWGVVIAIATAFVFMTLYMRKLLGVKEAKKAAVVNKTSNMDKLAVFLVVATISGLLSSIAVKKIGLPLVVSARQSQEVLGTTTVDYKELKVVELVSIDGVVKTYQDEGSETVAELIDSGKSAIEVERGEKRARVVVEGKEVWVGLENVMVK